MKQAVYVKPLTVSFPREIYSAIKELSDQRFVSMAQVVREIIEKAFSEGDNAERFNQAEAEIKSLRRDEQ
jgi:predicted DNA-binding protein